MYVLLYYLLILFFFFFFFCPMTFDNNSFVLEANQGSTPVLFENILVT